MFADPSGNVLGTFEPSGTLTIKVSSAHKSVAIDGIVIRRN
jgi:hypothetical protein